MNDVTRYPQNTPVSTFLTGDPIDVLWNINPEIAGLAYANRTGLLTPEILPAITGFRECQTQEKIATLKAIVDQLAIDADERKTHVIARTRERLGELERATVIEQTSIASDAQVRAEQLRSNTALEVQKLKYEINRQTIEQQTETQRYLSDNQVKATFLEAQALKEMIMFVETHKSELRAREIDAQLIAQVRTAELQYLAKIREAENYRCTREHHDRAAIIQAYLHTQAEMNRAALEYEIAKSNANTAAEQASYKALTDISKKLADTLKSGAKRIRYNGQTRFGEINIEMEADDGKQTPPN